MGTQANVKIVDPLTNENVEPIIANSDDGGIEVLTIAATVAVGSDQACRSAIIWTDAADTTVLIDGTAAIAADVNDFLLLQNTYLPMPVSNLKYLRFFGTNGAKIYILFRN